MDEQYCTSCFTRKHMINTRFSVQVSPKCLFFIFQWKVTFKCFCSSKLSAFAQCLHSSSYPSIFHGWGNTRLLTCKCWWNFFIIFLWNSVCATANFCLLSVPSQHLWWVVCHALICWVFSIIFHPGRTVKITCDYGLLFVFYNSMTFVKQNKIILLYLVRRLMLLWCFSPLQCLQQYVQLAIIEGGGAPITCPDMACQKTGVLLDSEVCPAKNQWYVGHEGNQKSKSTSWGHKTQTQCWCTNIYSTKILF